MGIKKRNSRTLGHAQRGRGIACEDVVRAGLLASAKLILIK